MLQSRNLSMESHSWELSPEIPDFLYHPDAPRSSGPSPRTSSSYFQASSAAIPHAVMRDVWDKPSYMVVKSYVAQGTFDNSKARALNSWTNASMSSNTQYRAGSPLDWRSWSFLCRVLSRCWNTFTMQPARSLSAFLGAPFLSSASFSVASSCTLEVPAIHRKDFFLAL